jgi:hypothetical protein
MRLFRTVLALLVVSGLALCAMSADAGGAKDKKAAGKLKEFKVNDKGEGTIVVTVKKKDTPDKDMTFKVTDKTKYKQGMGKDKEAVSIELAKFTTDSKDKNVVVSYTGEGDNLVATEVIIAGGKKPAN